MMQCQRRSLLAFFMLISACLAKDTGAEHVTTSRHKGRSHKVAASNLLETEDGTPTTIKALAEAKHKIMDEDGDDVVNIKELLNTYDDVNAYQSTSTEQNTNYHAAMDADGDKGVSKTEYSKFEIVMLTDYDDTFDAIATKQVEFNKVFNKYDIPDADGYGDFKLAPAEVPSACAAAFAKADTVTDGTVDRVTFEELIEDTPHADWLLFDLLDTNPPTLMGKRDGEVTYADFEVFQLSWELFNEIDTDHNGLMSKTELGNYFAKPDREIEADEWKQAQLDKHIPEEFRLRDVDGDGDGDVDREEWMTMETMVAKQLTDEFRECEKSGDKELSNEEINACTELPDMNAKFFALLNKDASAGGLDYWEFMTSFSEVASYSYFIALWKADGGVDDTPPLGKKYGNELTKGVDLSN